MADALNNEGWVKLHRKLLDNPRSSDPAWLAVWIYLLLRANHKPGKAILGKHVVHVKAGQTVTGRKKIAESTGLSEKVVRRILNELKMDQQIGQEGNRICSIITILNWESYQEAGQPTGQDRAKDGPRLGQDGATNKNDKNERSTTLSPEPSFELPRIEEVLTEAAMRAYPKEEAEAFWNHYESLGWVDRNGLAIRKWRPRLTNWVNRAKSEEFRKKETKPEPKQKQENIKIRNLNDE